MPQNKVYTTLFAKIFQAVLNALLESYSLLDLDISNKQTKQSSMHKGLQGLCFMVFEHSMQKLWFFQNIR